MKFPDNFDSHLMTSFVYMLFIQVQSSSTSLSFELLCGKYPK